MTVHSGFSTSHLLTRFETCERRCHGGFPASGSSSSLSKDAKKHPGFVQGASFPFVGHLSHDYQFQLPRLFPAYINHTDDLDYFVFHINPEMDMVVFHPALRTPRSCHGCSGVRCTLSGMRARDFISALIAVIVFFAAIGAQRSRSIYLRISLRWSLAWREIRTLCSSIQSRLRFLKDFVHIEGIVSHRLRKQTQRKH